ncbi:hypothetical protein PBAL39_18874 [Pedobacter sp. BAL39]|nr:hypothetical protein PBAL39_18874 [Pedobacter sp. BAL39]
MIKFNTGSWKKILFPDAVKPMQNEDFSF